jgi:transposase InsO family protein
MKGLCETLGVARSNIVERTKKLRKPRGHYAKPDDAWLLPLIRELVEKRPTYGYRRIHALLQRRLRLEGKPAVNHKRIYRLMKQHGLLLTRYTGKRAVRTHDGKVVTLKSNLRWCSDAFEIPCWNGEVVRVVFSLDCCDRELMMQTMERRFGAVDKLPHKIEWLSDNGKYYLAHDTVRFAQNINLIPCSTPAYSPQSNGMAEAFVKTFKRDYVYVKDLPDARTVMAQLPKWFEDYNEHHPHKGLKMHSPREYIRIYSHENRCPVL